MTRKIIFSFIILCIAFVGSAQDVTTMWPYKYSDFQNGTVYFKDQKTLSAQLNVHLLKSTLHYLNGDKIMEATSTDIAYVLIDNTIQNVIVPDKYYVCNNQLMRVLSGDSTAFVAELLLADFDAIKESGGAYGSSSNVQSTRKLSSLDVGGITITNHMELKSKKDDGSLLPLTIKYYMVVADKVYPATPKDIESQLPDNKKEAFKQFVKNHKIKWKDPDSLATLLEFIKN